MSARIADRVQIQSANITRLDYDPPRPGYENRIERIVITSLIATSFTVELVIGSHTMERGTGVNEYTFIFPGGRRQAASEPIRADITNIAAPSDPLIIMEIYGYRVTA